MTSERQISANRRNAQKSIGPRTKQGKERSRKNAVRHGLTAETVVGSLEDKAEYAAFAVAIHADYAPRSAVGRELVARLASVLWRLRRSTFIETGLFEIQADTLRRRRSATARQPSTGLVMLYRLLQEANGSSGDPTPGGHRVNNACEEREMPLDHKADAASVFLRISNHNGITFDRLGRYEKALWRQAAQTIVLLEASRCRPSRFLIP